MEEEKGRLIQLHIAEYSALTNRITYWVYLQYAIYSIAAVLFGCAATVWASTTSRIDLEWMILFGLLFIGWALFHCTYEMFTTVEYIEMKLIPWIRSRSLVSTNDFWGFEAHVNAFRSHGSKRLEWQFGLLVACAFGGGAILFLLIRSLLSAPWGEGDYGWLCACGYLVLVVAYKGWYTIRLQSSVVRRIRMRDEVPTGNAESEQPAPKQDTNRIDIRG